MARNHVLDLILDKGLILGMGTRSNYGFPCHALVVATGSLGAARAKRIDDVSQPRVESWQLKLDLLKLSINLWFAIITSAILTTAISSRKNRIIRSGTS